VIGEGANIDVFAEACLLGFGFESLDFVTNALVGSAACPFFPSGSSGDLLPPSPPAEKATAS
jgi:hypothetical protein